jgi:hypothetical protein
MQEEELIRLLRRLTASGHRHSRQLRQRITSAVEPPF